MKEIPSSALFPSPQRGEGGPKDRMRGAKPPSSAGFAACAPPHRLALLGTSPRWGEEGESRTCSVPPYAYAACRIAALVLLGKPSPPSDLPPCGGDARQGRGGCGGRHSPALMDKTQTRLSSINHLTPFSSPLLHSMPTITPSRIGYTGRRSGEAGPARVLRGRRKASPSGFAENGLPPATRGEMTGNGPAHRLLMPERARRACLCGTQGGRTDGFAGLFCPSA
ncbi:hypothetical protein SAMN02982989_3595 [Xaviernesmea oryzae]|uniref:Uncharacterized protein n=1 Tax=Xaviernesmea oryzae TaxID=464029 RepID=A0A1X7GCJ6_9HYPH|nr:hypothetical protein SAMN02982989_3595 [Xaviernesmea oryzae]